MSASTPSKKKERDRKAKKNYLRKQKMARLKPKLEKLEGLLHENITWDEGLKAFFDCGLIKSEEYEKLYKEGQIEEAKRANIQSLLKKHKKRSYT